MNKIGWWQYDERTSKDLEISYKNDEKTCELLIAGFLYIIDLENMLQIRRNDPSRRRKVKRDYEFVSKKGIAGLHQNKQNCPDSDNKLVHNVEAQEDLNRNVPETNDAEEVWSEHGTAEDRELENTLLRLSTLHLHNNEC